ncbi:hypothetical protein [Niabella drilacis]|uniref:Uncharacterized protein n=1 Tax=Niabella drilacis (strain DSM 25811 / CCM 8410 / CCUG 62505 / LMG 26954 / E90) TaxID=1285928 RepID=A0A1G6UNY7_NIADE|nr:hypothetical protein [Niabella drilacis]SDD43140.1 hypothetical protein SAMN04487894_10946 [Niabella drilacis]
MFRKLKDTISTIKEAVGLELHIGADERWQFNGVYVRFVDKKLKKIAEYHGIGDLKVLKAQLPKQVPLVLVINGKGILMRQTAEPENNLVNQLFPGSNPADFFTVTCPDGASGQYHFICRKTLVAQVLDTLQAAGLMPVSVGIGLEPLLQALPFLEAAEQVITAPSYSVTIVQQVIRAMDYGPRNAAGAATLPVGAEVYAAHNMNALGAVLQVLLKPADQLDGAIVTEPVTAAGADYKYYKLFHFTKWAVLTMVLALLLGNFFVFNHYFGKNKALALQAGLVKAATQRSLPEQVRSDSSYTFFINAGWNKNTRHGYYADRIAALAPETVRFSLLQTAPVQETVEMGDFVFAHNKIIVQGTSTDPTDLETFSRAIRNIQGVQAVTISNYLYKRDLLAAVFTLEINMQP